LTDLFYSMDDSIMVYTWQSSLTEALVIVYAIKIQYGKFNM